VNTLTQDWLEHQPYTRLSDGKYVIYRNKLHTVSVTGKKVEWSPLSSATIYNTFPLKANE
jgi:hypothetical protein